MEPQPALPTAPPHPRGRPIDVHDPGLDAHPGDSGDQVLGEIQTLNAIDNTPVFCAMASIAISSLTGPGSDWKRSHR